jgi:hypothetical protein
MWATNFVFGPRTNSAQMAAQIAPHLGHSAVLHVFDELPVWRPCSRAPSPWLDTRPTSMPRVLAFLPRPCHSIMKAQAAPGAPHPLQRSRSRLPRSVPAHGRGRRHGRPVELPVAAALPPPLVLAPSGSLQQHRCALLPPLRMRRCSPCRWRIGSAGKPSFSADDARAVCC